METNRLENVNVDSGTQPLPNSTSQASSALRDTISRALIGSNVGGVVPRAGDSDTDSAKPEIKKRRTAQEIADDVEHIYAMFNEYSNAYTAEWARLEKCDKMYRGAHWDDIPYTSVNEPRPVTPVLQSTIENIRAELNDQYPQAAIVADDPAFSEAASLLNNVIRENHIACDYEREYERMVYDLLVGGYMIQEAGYDAELNAGLGGAYVRHVDNRAVMFDPCATRLEDCRAIFKFSAKPISWFYEHYPKQAVLIKSDELALSVIGDEYLSDTAERRVMLIECWRRVYDTDTKKYRVHMTKVAGRTLLEDSRDSRPEGMYAHGKYPFTLTTMYMRKGCVLGYGIVDMLERQQCYADKLDQIVLKNALMASHNKLLVSSASGFDINDLRDWSKEVHSGENINGVKWFATAPLPAYIINYIGVIRDSIKQESGANDFSRGTTFGGVTAASAILALQEMSNKRTRNLAKSIHSAFAEAVRMELETEREYATLPRRISVGNGKAESFSNDIMRYGDKYPIEFQVSVKVAKENRFSVLSHNETIFKLVETGMITPDIALSMLIFDGKDEVVAKMNDKMNKTSPIVKEEGENGRSDRQVQNSVTGAV